MKNAIAGYSNLCSFSNRVALVTGAFSVRIIATCDTGKHPLCEV